MLLCAIRVRIRVCLVCVSVDSANARLLRETRVDGVALPFSEINAKIDFSHARVEGGTENFSDAIRIVVSGTEAINIILCF